MSNSKERCRRNSLDQAIPRVTQRHESFQTDSGIEIDPVYTAKDLSDRTLDYVNNIGFPGEYPYTRGVQPNMYRGRIWTMRQYSGYATAADTNQRFRYLLDQGQTGLSVAFDLPTQIGYDSDHPLAQGEVGKVGVPICSLDDMETLLKDIPLDRVSTSMTINSTASVLLCLYVAAAKRQGVSQTQISGTLQNDILKEYIARGTYTYPPRPSMRLVVDTVEFATRHMPRWNPISISGYHIREAGATAVQELAFTMADGFEYVRWCQQRGLDVDEFAPRLSFFFNVDNYFFEEIAKFRAARKVWAQEMRDTFHAKNPRSWWMRTHAQTAGWTLTAQQPENNAVRVALQALAAVLGGTQSLHTNAADEAWALPSEKAALLALRTQQIIAHETGVTDTVDPLGGSYFLEKLTGEMEAGAYDYFRRIEDLGGVIPALETGFLQREIAEASYRYQREADNKERITVGVNEYVSEGAPDMPLLRVDRKGEEHHLERLNRVRRQRDGREVAEKLRALEQAARGSENLMPPLLEAVKAYATLGETMGVFREVFGEYQPSWGY